VPKPELDIGANLLLGSSFALCLELTVRLLAVSQFGGNAANFDFGIKCSADKGCSRNLAFNPEFNSFGHCIQGCSVFFLFPACDSLIWYVFSRNSGIGGCLIRAKDVFALGLIIYPVYNIIKRARQSANNFATSSFCNNGSEWACGFLLGFSLALFCTAYTAQDGHAMVNESTLRFRRWARILAGTVLAVATLVTAILFGLSWVNVDGHQHDDDDENNVGLIIMLACPVVVAGVLGSGLHVWAVARPVSKSSAI
jgi:hypothetical protein